MRVERIPERRELGAVRVEGIRRCQSEGSRDFNTLERIQRCREKENSAL